MWCTGGFVERDWAGWRCVLEGYKAVCSWGSRKSLSSCFGKMGGSERLSRQVKTAPRSDCPWTPPHCAFSRAVSLTCPACLTGNKAATCKRWPAFQIHFVATAAHVLLAVEGSTGLAVACRGSLCVHKQSAHPNSIARLVQCASRVCRLSVCRLRHRQHEDCCRTRSRCNGRLPASLADEPCHVGGQSMPRRTG